MLTCRKGGVKKREKEEGGDDDDDGMKEETKTEPDDNSDGEGRPSNVVPGEEADVRDVIYTLESFGSERAFCETSSMLLKKNWLPANQITSHRNYKSNTT